MQPPNLKKPRQKPGSHKKPKQTARQLQLIVIASLLLLKVPQAASSFFTEIKRAIALGVFKCNKKSIRLWNGNPHARCTGNAKTNLFKIIGGMPVSPSRKPTGRPRTLCSPSCEAKTSFFCKATGKTADRDLKCSAMPKLLSIFEKTKAEDSSPRLLHYLYRFEPGEQQGEHQPDKLVQKQ